MPVKHLIALSIPNAAMPKGGANALQLCGICHNKQLNEPQLAQKRLKAALKVRERIQHPGADETRNLLSELA